MTNDVRYVDAFTGWPIPSSTTPGSWVSWGMPYRLRNYAAFARANLRELFGAEKRYCIRGGYTHRQEYSYFDDTALKDEWQKEVYLRAAKLAAEQNLKTIYDVGCGSGYKLVHYLRNYETVGFDVPETVEFLNHTYPDRIWKPIMDHSSPAADLVICADVIEHVTDPVALIERLKSLSKKWIILSTPDREVVYSKMSPYLLGPPRNTSHIREWSFKEFYSFVSEFLDVREHYISNRTQATQMIIAVT